MTVLIDGGLSSALETLGHRLDDALWTARLVERDPEAVIEAHLGFLRAGARVLITASYQASVPSLVRHGLSPNDADALLRRTTDLAKEAVRRFGEHDPLAAMRTRVAASVGPYGAVLANGAEYTGDYPIGRHELLGFHRERLAILSDTGPDLFAIETIPSVAEAEVIVEAMADLGHRVAAWMCCTARDGALTAAGDPVKRFAEVASSSPAVEAVGVNCTAPEHVESVLARMSTVTDLPLVAYPNHGARWDAMAKAWSDPSPEPDDDTVARWREAGAGFIGGCCGYDPAAIARLGARLRA